MLLAEHSWINAFAMVYDELNQIKISFLPHKMQLPMLFKYNLLM